MHARNSTPIDSRNAMSSPVARTMAGRRLSNTVRFLTRSGRMRRLFDGSARFTGGVASLAVLLVSASLAESIPASRWHSIADIAEAAENYVRRVVGETDQRISPQAGRLDPRLQLPRCSEVLEAFQQRGSKITSRTVVGVRCDGVNPWKIYVPVDVVVTETVLVTRRTLPSGHIFASDDVTTAQRDVSRLVSGYLSRPQNLIGKKLKHALIAGRVITPSMLKADIMVRRGQTVTIVVRNDSLNIRMMGKALTDGTENQRIRVENTNSKRVVEGIVRSPEQVEVLVY